MASNKLRSETGLIKPYVEAEIALTTLKNDNISGDVHQRSARLLRYIRITGQPDSFNSEKANEPAGMLLGASMVFKQYPEAIQGSVPGLRAYRPQSDRQKVEYPLSLVNEALALLDDALIPYLDTGDSRTAADWAVALALASSKAKDTLSAIPLPADTNTDAEEN